MRQVHNSALCDNVSTANAELNVQGSARVDTASTDIHTSLQQLQCQWLHRQTQVHQCASHVIYWRCFGSWGTCNKSLGSLDISRSCIITTSTASVDSYTICFKSIKTPNWAQLIQEDTSCHNVLTVKFDLFVCHLFLPPATDDQAI